MLNGLHLCRSDPDFLLPSLEYRLDFSTKTPTEGFFLDQTAVKGLAEK